jgi:hypothetical protein
MLDHRKPGQPGSRGCKPLQLPSAPQRTIVACGVHSCTDVRWYLKRSLTAH